VSVPVSVPVPVPEATTDPIADRLLDMVSTKTGYPRDMLAMDLDLEADLGIDTVKQAEIFGEVRSAYNLPKSDTLKLRDYPTLGHIIAFVRTQRPDLTPAAKIPTANHVATTEVVSQVKAEAAQPSSITSSAVPRRLPVPVLRPALDLCKPTGITLGAGRRVVVIPR